MMTLFAVRHFARVVSALACAVFLAGCEKPALQTNREQAKAIPQLVVPDQGAYTGAYIDFGDTEDNVTLEAIEEFERETGKHQAIVAFSSYWGENRFPATQASIVTTHRAVPLIFWSPWDYPYREDLVQLNGPDKYRLESIYGGKWDEYIDQWADGAKAVGTPIFVSLGNEMNGDWFPWSGCYYGSGKVVPGSDPPKYSGPETFKRAYRYIVDRVRARGAVNVLWVFHVNNFPEPYESWNYMKEYYPGKDYVDWLGVSVYGQQFPDSKWDLFAEMLDKPYAELSAVDTTKPIMVTEWGVGEFPSNGDKPKWIESAFAGMETKYPRIKAAIYWNERWQNAQTLFYTNMRINSSPPAQEAYRRCVANPFWIGYPLYR